MPAWYIWTSLFVIHQAFSQSNRALDRLTGGENIAKGKSTLQSSSYIEDHFIFSSNLSVDGNDDADFSHKSCSHTDPTGIRPAWWSVDFGEERILKKIIIFNRKKFTGRLNNARILGITKKGRVIEIDSSANYNQDRITIDVTINELLQNVTIILREDSEQNIISICEVEIYADLNVARRKPVNQTSTWENFVAELAVDGNSNPYFDVGKSCTAVLVENKLEASWSVNLEKEYFVSFIKIFNRKNENGWNYEQRLAYFTVMAYTRDSNALTLYTDTTGNPGEVIELPLYNTSKPVTSIKIRIPQKQNGEMSVLTLCEVEVYKAIECQIYRLDNGRVSIAMNGDNQQNFTYRATLRLECFTGFQFSPNVASTTATCQANGIWTDHRSCLDINECELDRSSCNNHGLCKNTAGSFTCQCNAGYTGLKCETDINECNLEGPSPCNNQGDCVDATANFTCHCHAGYTGRKCETDINECQMPDYVCQNHGQCTNTDGGFSCQCNNGYTGGTCETDIDECAQAAICHYHGQCSNTDGSFACHCSTGYTGTTCENDRQHALSLKDGDSGDCDCHGQIILPIAILIPLCLILIVTNAITCLQLRRYAETKKKRLKIVAPDLNTQRTEPYEELQMNTRGMSEYDVVNVEGEPSFEARKK